MTLLQWLEQRYPTAKRQTLKRMVEAGRVIVNGRPADRLKLELPEPHAVTVDESPQPKSAEPTTTSLDIVHEDADLLVVNKPAGLLTSTVPREPRPTLLAQVRDYVKGRERAARVGLIHRLDRDASGLLVFSKNDAAYESLKRQFFNHSVDRVYAAVVEGVPAEPKGTIRTKLVELPNGNVVVTKQPDKGQIAVTEYVVMRHEPTPAGERSLLRVKLQTGRKHQIRAQLAHRGTPIVNDPLYGERKPDGRLMLAAILLELRHPGTQQRETWELPIPKELREAMETQNPKPRIQRESE